MAYPYTEDHYATLLRRAAQETRAAMMRHDMLDGVRPKRPPIQDRADSLLDVIRRSPEPLTINEIAAQSDTVAIRPLMTVLRHLVASGHVVRTETMRPRRGGGAPVATYACAGGRHG